MGTLDDEIRIKVVRKEELTKAEVHFECDNQTTAWMKYIEYAKLFNWADAKGSECKELTSFLDYAFGITFNQPKCHSIDYPAIPLVDSEVVVEDSEHLVRLSLQGDLERVILAIDDDPYRTLYTGKACGYNNQDVYAVTNERIVSLPTDVSLMLNQRPQFKLYVGSSKALEFELGVTKDGRVNCDRIWGIKDWCDRTTAPKIDIKEDLVNTFVDPTYITSEEVLAILQERGKIDVGEVPPALEKGVSGWVWRGGDAAPLSNLGTCTTLAYNALWLAHDRIEKAHLSFTIDLAYGNPPTSTAAIDMSNACNGTLPCAPIIRASLDELPIVEEGLEVNGTIDISTSDIPTTLYQQTESGFGMVIINTGTAEAEYQVAITFVGTDVANEETFWSGWSRGIAPNGSTTLPVEVKLSKEAIPAGQETASYSIYTRLEAV